MLRNYSPGMAGLLGAGLFEQHGNLEALGGGKLGTEQLLGRGQGKMCWAPAEWHVGRAAGSAACSMPAIHHAHNAGGARCFKQGDN